MFEKFRNIDYESIKGRIIVGILMFVCWTVVYTQRGNFNVIIAQVVSINGPAEHKYVWTQIQKSTALMSFYAGYWLVQVPGGVIGERFGAKKLIGLSVLVSSILCILIPLAIQKSPYIVVAIRVLFGIAQGVFPPCFLIYMANWFPDNCRSTAMGLIFPGADFGSILAMAIPSAIAKNPNNWPLSFYLFGGFGIFWVICWIIFYSDDPLNNKWTSQKEKKFISENVRRKQITDLKKFPIKEAFKSKPVISVIICHSVDSISINYVLALMPSIILDLYYIEVKDQFSTITLASIMVWIGGILSCRLFDYISSKTRFPKIQIRKFLNILSLLPSGLFFIFATLIPLNIHILGIVLFLIACFFSGFGVAVCMPNIGDICPQYSGIVFGFMNTISTLVSLASIQIAYAIVTDQHKPQQWQLVFGILIIIQVIAVLIFTKYAEGDIQPWAIQEDECKKSEFF